MWRWMRGNEEGRVRVEIEELRPEEVEEWTDRSRSNERAGLPRSRKYT